MARIYVTPDELIVALGLFERMGAFVHGDARIPMLNVRTARAVGLTPRSKSSSTIRPR